MERIKRNTEWQGPAEVGRYYIEPQSADEVAPRRHREIEVLEDTQQTQIDHQRYNQAEPARARSLPLQKREPRKIAHRCGKGQQDAIFVIPERVEDISAQRQPDVALILRCKLPKNEIGDGKEEVEKINAVKEHRYLIRNFRCAPLVRSSYSFLR